MNARAHAEATRLATSLAEQDMFDAEIIRDLTGAEEEVCDCLARCFANLGHACNGEQIGIDAITTALHNLHKRLVALRADVLIEEVL